LLILISYIINAFCDAIDHAKGASELKTLWHLSKAISYGILISVILFQMDVGWKVWALVWLALWIYWELFYRIFIKLEAYRLDDKFDISLLRKIWRY